MTNELTVQERASQALSAVGLTEAELRKQAAKTADVTEIKDDTDYKLVASGYRALRKTIKLIEDTGMDARRDARAFADAVIQEQRRLTGIVEPESERLKALKSEVDDAEKRRQAEIAAREQARVDAIQAKFDAILEHEKAGAHESAEVLAQRIQFFTDLRITQADFEERTEEAEREADRVCGIVLKAQKARAVYDEEQTRLAEERKALEEAQAKLREEQAKADAERKAAEDKLRAEREALEREKFEQQAKERAEREAKEKAERAEQERVEREKREAEAKAEAERKAKEEAERIERQKPDKEKLNDYASRLLQVEAPQIEDPELYEFLGECIHDLTTLTAKIGAKCATRKVRKAS